MAMPSGRFDDLPPVLTTQQVADLLGLTPVTIRQMVKDGRLLARRVPGSRKFMFLAEDVAELLRSSVVTMDDNATPSRVDELAPAAPPSVDPCDIWGAAPTADGHVDFGSRCLQRWLDLAAERGVVPDEVYDGNGAANGYVGEVVIDGLGYIIRHGRRQRVLIVDDDGADRWELIDSVWVEPSVPVGASDAAPPYMSEPGDR